MTVSRIFLSGHRGMVGSAIQRRLARENVEVLTAGHEVLDLREQADVRAYMQRQKPDAVILAAAKVGGILANDSFPADFLGDNLAIELTPLPLSTRITIRELSISAVFNRAASEMRKPDA